MRITIFQKNKPINDSQEMFPLHNKHLIHSSHSDDHSSNIFIRAALCCGVVALVLIFSLLATFLHYQPWSQESQDDAGHNVLLLGGVNHDNVPEFRLELINLGYCPDIDEKSIHIPQLPVLLFNLTARYDRGGDGVVICGVMEENMRHQCWILRNGTSWWEMINDTDTSETATNNHEDTAPHNPCSHRAGAVTTLLGQTLYMFGGKRCVVKMSKQI